MVCAILGRILLHILSGHTKPPMGRDVVRGEGTRVIPL